MRIPELLMPVGSPSVLPVALRYGADAVYLGSDALSLRAKAENFTEEALFEAVRYTHSLGKKLYLAVNIFAHEGDLDDARTLFRQISQADDRPDAFIISDFGLFRLARELCPSVPVHISTQTNSTNSETFRFWYEQGVRRVVCARELSLVELKALKQHIPADMETEVFVHGSMCMSYSGRCLISNFLNGRDANRGLCTQPCRWKYYLCEETRPGEYMPVEESARGTYLYNSRDLCMISYLPELLEAGVSSLKVEGRMKNELYVATIARAYRRALDALAESEAAYRKLLPWCEEEVLKVTTRDYCTGFYFGQPGPGSQNFASSAYRQDYRFLGVVRQDAGGPYILQKNKFSAGDPVQAIRPDGSDLTFSVKSFLSETGERQLSCPHPGQKLYLETEAELRENDVLREKNP
ncbi:MAG: U32 family peptidase [Lachnospiraceae bacterium]|nr:U32 family peptidase [Lachnospiraceae bacterium]